MPPITDRSVVEKVREIISVELDKGRGHLLEDKAYRIFRLIGFDTPEFLNIEEKNGILTADLASIPGDRVICKLLSPQIPHRSEHGGIAIVEKDVKELGRVFDDFSNIAGRLGAELSGMLIAELLDIDESIPWQLLLSLRQDRSFGPVIVMGLGGTGTEVYQDGLKNEKGLFIRSASRVLESADNGKYLEKTLFYPIISGSTRISPRAIIDTGKIEEALTVMASLAESFSPPSELFYGTIEELEINPLQITVDGKLVPLDALAKISRRRSDDLFPPQKKIDRLLRPEKILIIGASATRMNMGRTILANLRSDGSSIGKDDIVLLHPEESMIDGCRAFRSLGELPEKIDMTIFTIPAGDAAAALLEELISSGITESIILISGGFGELEEGKELDRKIRKAISDSRRGKGGGTVVNGPNCMGIISRPGGYNTFFLPGYKISFDGRFGRSTAVLSQSGAWLVTLISTLSAVFSPRYMVSVGNQIDLTITDYMINLKDDPGTDLFCLYLEGFKPGGGKRFLDVSREIIRSGKKIIVYKTGRTAEGAAAAASHTAAMATDHEIFDRLLAEEGVYQADTLEDIEDAVKVLTLLGTRNPGGNRVGICSDAGYECSVAADRLGSMVLAQFTPSTRTNLGKHLPAGIIDIHNPTDTTPAVTTAEFGKCVRAIIDDANTDCIIISNVAATATQENLEAGPGHDEDITRESSHPNTLIRLFNSTAKPVIVCMNEGRIYDAAVAMMEDAGIPVFRKIDRAMKAMDIFLRFSGNNDETASG
ncbi:MAG: acetate--CoA ligase family protein [Candidatus Krumholzibacteriota bacterium]|nr:acetate--CoA ligase family protein [Candidatus Krumholzibacteriota bacterium]